jgi:sulfite reductase (ferredoxin)
MTSVVNWKTKLEGKLAPALEREIDIFETQIELRKKGKIEERLFAETRLRRGVYGQRYDNGQRHDGEQTQQVAYPAAETKGPSTLWDAPGMMRIKIPLGRLTADQLEVIAELAEEYSDRILHVTTRQDVQLHFVHIEDTPDLMRRLAAAGVTTREACGNTVRNVTACPIAGVCREESFDVTPYAHAVTYFLLGHDDTQDFGRKFKVAFSGCKDNPCGLVTFHDIGCIAAVRGENGSSQRGFEFYVGGGLGAVPQAAQLFEPFVAEEELLPLCQAIARVFGRLGEKANRQKARMKFLIKKLGLPEFKRLVVEERAKLRPDPRWTAFLADLHSGDERPLRPAAALPPAPHPDGFARWARHNVQAQKQPGHATASITLPLGDLTSDQARQLATIARKYSGVALRTTAEQNMLLRWVSEGDLPALYSDLVAAGLAEPGASTITDVTACPGTDTCKLGISSSRALAAELRHELGASGAGENERMQGLHIKASGCFNSCGQHHVADLGFLGVSRNVNGRRVPHFQLVIGGKWTHNAGSYGLAIGAIPSRRVPAFARKITEMYARDRQEGELFADYITRIGKKTVRAMVEETQIIPSHEQDPSFYTDWGDPREYTIDDMGVGECAGEVVPYVQVGLASSEREIFEAQVLLDEGNIEGAGQAAYRAMLEAARALTREKNANLGTEPEEIASEFRTHLVETQLFWDPYAGGKFAQYFFRAHDDRGKTTSAEAAHQLIEEAQLFVDAAHQCYTLHGAALSAPTARVTP